MVDEATPAMVNIVLKLPFINMIINLSTNSLHSSALINLTKSALQIIPITSHGIITGGSTVPLDICSIEYSQRFPFLNVFTKIRWNMKNRQDLIVARFSFENVLEFSREAGGGKGSGALSD